MCKKANLKTVNEKKNSKCPQIVGSLFIEHLLCTKHGARSFSTPLIHIEILCGATHSWVITQALRPKF